MVFMATLNNHPVWENLSEVINGIDANSLLGEHLALCDYQISGSENMTPRERLTPCGKTAIASKEKWKKWNDQMTVPNIHSVMIALESVDSTEDSCSP